MGKTFLTASPPPRAHPTLSSLAPNSLDCVRSFVLPLLVRFRAWVIIVKKKRRRPHFPLSLPPSLASEIGSAVAWSQSQSAPKAAAAAASDEKRVPSKPPRPPPAAGEIRGGCGGKRPPSGNCALLRGGEKKIRCFFPPLSSHPGQSSDSHPVLHTGARGPDPDSSGGLESEVKRAERRGGGSGKKGKEGKKKWEIYVRVQKHFRSLPLSPLFRQENLFFLNLFFDGARCLPPPQLNFPLIKLSLSLSFL